MRKSIYYPLFVLFAFLAINCGSSNKDLTKVSEGEIPEWYLSLKPDPNYLQSSKTATSQDMQLAIDKAVTDARADISRQLDVKINSLEKQFKEEVGSDANSTLLTQFTQATKTITSQEITGSDVKEKKILKDGAIWRAYVLVQYPIGAANQTLMEQLKRNKEFYTRFQSTKAFEDLDKSVKAYEDAKNK